MKTLRALLVLALLSIPWAGAVGPDVTGITGVALAAPQDAPAPPAAPDVDVKINGGTTERHVISFENPIVLVAGGVGLLLLIVLIALAVRGGGTTIVRER